MWSTVMNSPKAFGFGKLSGLDPPVSVASCLHSLRLRADDTVGALRKVGEDIMLAHRRSSSPLIVLVPSPLSGCSGGTRLCGARRGNSVR